MSGQDAQGAAPGTGPGAPRRPRLARLPRPGRPLLGWFASSAALAVPQAAAPILFALIALPVTGSADSGAALVLAMTVAQVLGAVPVARLGRRVPALASVGVLVAVRTAALAAIALLAGLQAPFSLLVAGSAAAGLVSGAAFGHLRAALNPLVPPGRLPRALGVSATLNEVVFVLSPALASVLGTASPLLAMWAVVALGAVPLVAMPRTPSAASDPAAVADASSAQPTGTGSSAAGLSADAAPSSDLPRSAEAGRQALPRRVWLWLGCSMASSAAIATIETGAVSLAVAYGLAPAWGSIFPVALCLASVAGGVWVSVRGRTPRLRTVVAWLGATALGVGIVAVGQAVAWTLLGAVMVGLVLAPLGTFYSLMLDRLSPPARRAEVFALLRTASSVGVIVASGLIAVASVRAALLVVPALPALALLAVVLVAAAGGRPGTRRDARQARRDAR
ncbi:MFS transporter [Brachybacterium phenoliresistens]|uniref:MFS transporter n=1 Tax=Brachybacterium phenoliresistens TaxID=396014 RepID=Z9JSX1_9MICO|nr:MFS transporter [Brachybacterium phenoliresistens]EWS81299.1 MFS transporter [Brachybacterium phenoliresistens]